MNLNKYQTTVLALAGFTALSIGGFIAFDPVAFYSSYDISIGGNTDMLSDLRASGVNLSFLGAVMLAGVAVASIRSYAIAASLVVFSAFPAGRDRGSIIKRDSW